MVKLRKVRFAYVFALLPYILAANAGLIVGWQCLEGSYKKEVVDSTNLPWHASRIPAHNHPNHSHSIAVGAEWAAHCCACSGSPTFEHSLAAHFTSSIGSGDQASTFDHESSFADNPFSALTRVVTCHTSSHYSPVFQLVSLRTVVLLI